MVCGNHVFDDEVTFVQILLPMGLGDSARGGRCHDFGSDDFIAPCGGLWNDSLEETMIAQTRTQ